MGSLYFEDFTVGRRFTTPGKTLTEGEIVAFAMLYDPQPFHIDAEAAKESLFGGLIASGFQTLALCFRLFHMTGLLNAGSVAGAGCDELRWHRPVRPGDTLRVEVEVLEATPSRTRPQGTIRFAYRAFNQRGEPALSFILLHIIARRPAGNGD